jgi:RNA polymerase sigma-70 factor (ECF subfamily)
MQPADERELLGRLGQGDSTAFDALYEAYRPRLFAFLARLSRRRDVAEDLLEETWLRLVAGSGTIPAGTPLGAWLFTVARNLFISYCRSRMLEAERIGELTRLSSEPRRGDSPFEALVSTELRAGLERALARLSVSDREVLLLVGVEGLKPAEAAGVLGVSSEALRQRLSRARSRLAGHMADTAPAKGRAEGDRE